MWAIPCARSATDALMMTGNWPHADIRRHGSFDLACVHLARRMAAVSLAWIERGMPTEWTDHDLYHPAKYQESARASALVSLNEIHEWATRLADSFE